MKKSEMTVTMPLSTWEEYEKYKESYKELTKELAGCFDDSLLKAGGSQAADFDVKKALDICKNYMPYSIQKADIEIKI